jgi:hypothetical protein
MVDQPWHNTHQCDRVWCRQQTCWAMASRDYGCALLDLLRAGNILQLWYLPYDVCSSRAPMPCSSSTDTVTDGQRKPSRSPK